MSIFFSSVFSFSTWGRQINQTGKYYFRNHFALSRRPDTLTLNLSCSYFIMVTKLDIITNFYYCYLLTTFLLLHLRFVLPLRSSFTWGSQLIYYPPLEFTVNFRRGSHQSKSCCYVYPPHLLLFLLFNCLAKTLHGSKNSK